MTSFDIQGTAEQGSQPGVQQQDGLQQQPGQSPSMGSVPGLPPTALAMQMQSLNDEYARAQGADGGMQAMGMQAGALGGAGKPVNADYARSSLQDMAERLAKGYGLQFGRGSLVDEFGQFQQTPDQLAAGGDVSNTAASMNQISEVMNQRRIEQQQNKATASLQAGAGLLQQGGRGSLAALQSGFYQAMAQNYTNPNLLPEQQDFNYWIARDQLDEARADEIERLKAEEKKSASTISFNLGGSQKQRGGSRPGPYAPAAFAGL
jgi:hypothetical protein